MKVMGGPSMMSLIALGFFMQATRAIALDASAPADPAARLQTFVSRHCVSCHGKKDPKAAVSLDGFANLDAVLKGRRVWEKVLDQLENRAMPPEERPAPSEEDYDAIVRLLKRAFSEYDAKVRDPGRVTIRRLNRAEYNNTIRDLVGVEFRPADDFPADNLGYGFDNIGDVLSLSPLQMEQYLSAAERIAELAIVDPKTIEPTRLRVAAARLKGGAAGRGTRKLSDHGELFFNPVFSREGDYVIRLQGRVVRGRQPPARLVVRIADKPVGQVAMAADGKTAVYEVKVKAAQGGRQKLSIAFDGVVFATHRSTDKIGDDSTSSAKSKAKQAPTTTTVEPTLLLNWVEFVGPVDRRETDFPASHRKIMTTKPTSTGDYAAARSIATNFARRAYRRPVQPAEVDRLVAIFEQARRQGSDFEAAMRFVVQSVLVSPHFLFRVELHAKPTDKGVVEPVDDYQLASRLSYFLWSSMPDDELFLQAERNQLRDPANLERQALRMLRDPKAKALTENFAGQWLETRKLMQVAPDPETFRDFDDALRSAMKQETELFFESIVKEDRSVLEFIDARYTFLNERLAKLYGIPFKGRGFRRVELTDPNRGGVLAQASFLTVTSNPTRTSPVKRGKWVLEQLLNDPPPPPPPGVGDLKDDGKVDLKAPLRKRLEQHRSKADCASCHQKMDPIGFALENFNGIGAWRKNDGKDPVDNSGVLASGESFRGPAELKKVLLARKDQFVRCLAEKLLTYAMGRGVESYDKTAVDQIVRGAKAADHRFSALVAEVVKSQPFRFRRGDGDSR